MKPGRPGSIRPTSWMPARCSRRPSHTAPMLSTATVMGPSGPSHLSRLHAQGYFRLGLKG